MERSEFQQCAWVAIRRGTWGGLRWRLGVRRGKRTTLRSALGQANGRLVLARYAGWVYVFGVEPGTRLDLAEMSRQGGEACGFSIDLQQKTFLCLRYRQGRLVRRLEQRQDGPLIQEGRRGQKREPNLSMDGGRERLDAWAVLALAGAWQCDPRYALDAHADAWVLEPQPGWNPPHRSAWKGGLVLLLCIVAVLLVAVFVGWGERARQTERAIARCSAQASCETCERCALSTAGHPCADLARECAVSEPCHALWSCLDLCRTQRSQRIDPEMLPPEGLTLDFSCDQQCIDKHADGVEAYRAWRSCTVCDACESTCGWMDQLNVGELRLVECSTP